MRDIYASKTGLLAALHTIQDECRNHRDCETCPLRVNSEHESPNLCGVRDVIPDCWDITDLMNWRAFK